MDWLTIKGGTVYDGRYEFDLDATDFTVREWGWLKRHSGYLPMTIEEGFAGADPELYCVFACIALYRARRIAASDVPRVLDVLADVPGTLTIRLEADPKPEGEEAAEEPDHPPSPESLSLNGGSSGNGSKTNSETSAETPADSGTPGSATSVSRRVI